MFTDADTLLADTHASEPSATEEHPELPRGAMVGRYCVLERVGAGAMGVVYAAYDPKLDRKVALKVVRSSAADAPVSDILAEAQALAQLNHPSVVSVYDVGEHDGGVFMAMEFVLGVSLRAWLEAYERSLTEILATFRKAAAGLSAAHVAGIVHRDVKPDNVMVADGSRVIVMDFGLARRRAADSDGAREHAGHDGETTRSAGTPAYMSPEQFRGRRVDARSDQYSFCVALYEALSGDRPFRGDNLADLASAVTNGEWADERPLASVPRWLRAAVLRGLQRNPDERHPSMDALIGAIDRGMNRRRRVVLASVGVLAASGLAGGVWLSEEDARACQREALQMTEQWLPEIDARIAAGFAALPRDAEDTTRRVSQRVEAFATGWEQARTSGCAARYTVGTLSASEHAGRTQCLHEQRAFVDGLFASLSEAGPDALWAIAAASIELPVPQQCEDPRVDRGAGTDLDAATREMIREAAQALAQAEAKVHRNERAAAQQQLAAWLERLEDVPAPLMRSRILHELAKIHFGRGDAEAGETTARRAVLEAGRSGDPVVIANTWQMRIEQLASLDPERAKTLLEALEAAVAVLGDAPDRQCGLDLTRARVALVSGDVAAMEPLLASAQAHLERGTSTVRTRVAIASLRSAAAFELGDYDTAAAQSKLRRELLIEAHGPAHPNIAGAELNLGHVCIRQNDRACARRHFERTIELAAPGDSMKTSARLALGQLAYDEGDLEAAAEHARRVLIDRRAQASGPTSLLVPPLQLLVDVGLRQGDGKAALERAEEIAEVAAATTAPNHPHRSLAQSSRGRALLMLDRVDEAIAAHEDALRMRRAKLPARPRSVGVSLVQLARCHLANEENSLAAARATEAIDALTKADPDGTWIAEARLVRATAIDDFDLALARRLALQAQADLEPHADKVPELVEEARAWLAAHPESDVPP